MRNINLNEISTAGRLLLIDVINKASKEYVVSQGDIANKENLKFFKVEYVKMCVEQEFSSLGNQEKARIKRILEFI
jgi:hypothetical protein